MNTGIAGRHLPTMQRDEWLTPKHILEALGPFDLDPCAPTVRPWPTARHHYTKDDDGLTKEWFGRVWCNPPYGKQTATWLMLMAMHGNGVALTFARTETGMFRSFVWLRADAVFFLFGRLTFCDTEGKPARFNSGGPSCLIAYGKQSAARLENCGLAGHFVPLGGMHQ